MFFTWIFCHATVRSRTRKIIHSMVLLCSQGCRWDHISDHKCRAEKMKLSFKAAKVDVQWTISWSWFAKQLLTSLEMALAVSYLLPTSILEMTTVNCFDKYFWLVLIFCHFPLRSLGMILCTYLYLWWGSPGEGKAEWWIKLTTTRTEAPHPYCFWAHSFDT